MNHSPAEPTDAAFVTELRSFRDALNPVQRNAALRLAAAQRDLATALASSPAAIANEPDVTDPEVSYARWLDLMRRTEHEARADALRSAEEGRRHHVDTALDGRPFTFHGAAVARASVHRAAINIEAMTSDDDAAGAAARQDVLHIWYADDVEAEIAFTLDYAERSR